MSVVKSVSIFRVIIGPEVFYNGSIQFHVTPRIQRLYCSSVIQDKTLSTTSHINIRCLSFISLVLLTITTYEANHKNIFVSPLPDLIRKRAGLSVIIFPA